MLMLKLVHTPAGGLRPARIDSFSDFRIAKNRLELRQRTLASMSPQEASKSFKNVLRPALHSHETWSIVAVVEPDRNEYGEVSP